VFSAKGARLFYEHIVTSELLKSDSICNSYAQMKKGPVFSDSQCITSIAAVMKHCQNFKHGFQSSGAVSCRQARPFRAFRRGILVAAPYDAPMK